MNNIYIKEQLSDYTSIVTKFPGFTFIDLKDEVTIKKLMINTELDDALHLETSILLTWNGKPLLNTDLFQLSLWDNLIEFTKEFSESKECTTNLGIDTVLLKARELNDGYLQWTIFEEIYPNDVYFQVTLQNKEQLIETLVNGGKQYYSSLLHYGFKPTKYLESQLEVLKQIKIYKW